jgi:predicted phosphodiesterase
MKIITYSDLHLEFGTDFMPISDSCADLMILAGDIIVFYNYRPLSRFWQGWNKPILYVAGNHEYYSGTPIARDNEMFKQFLAERHPNVTFLQDEAITIDGVNFFGGTMWTNFDGGNSMAIDNAQRGMNDYRYIKASSGKPLHPADTILYHEHYVQKLAEWFEQDLSGSRVVISHHAPVVNPKTKYGDSKLMPAFNSLDMLPIIEKYQPNLWVYGHTHECDDQTIGETRIISNQRGYLREFDACECEGFDESGLVVEI